MQILATVLVVFSYNQTDFYTNPGPHGLELKGPIWHPLRALANLAAWNMFILVPIFYWNIFKFRKAHALTTGKDGDEYLKTWQHRYQ